MWLVWIGRVIGLSIVIGAGMGIVYKLVYDTLGRWMK